MRARCYIGAGQGDESEKAHPPGSTSADGTFIRTRYGPVEVKLGIWWTGARLQSPSAVHKKFLLQVKGSYASTQGHDLFGQTLYALAAHRAGIAKAREVFFISDGACPYRNQRFQTVDSGLADTPRSHVTCSFPVQGRTPRTSGERAGCCRRRHRLGSAGRSRCGASRARPQCFRSTRRTRR